MVGSLAPKVRALLDRVGGWRTLAEAVATNAVFVVVSVITGEMVPAVLAAVGLVFVLAVVRLLTRRKKWYQVAVPLAVVALSAVLAGGTGRAVGFYLPDLLLNLVLWPVVLASMLVRFPIIGVVVEGLGRERGERLAWRRDRRLRRTYQLCSGVWLIKFSVAAAIMIPLYLGESVVGLAVVSTLLALPAMAGCLYLCWRLLRAEPAGHPLVTRTSRG